MSLEKSQLSLAPQVVSTGAFRQTRKRVIGRPQVRVRCATFADIPEMMLVEEEAWKDPVQRASGQILASRIDLFPAGTLVAESEGSIWGYVVVQRMFGNYFDSAVDLDLSWAVITDHGTMQKTHHPNGDILYGVNLSVSSVAPPGTQYQLMECVGKLAILLDVREILLGGRIPSYHKFVERCSAEDYVQLKVHNRPRDPEIWLYARAGLDVVRVLPNYFPDPDSCDYGVLLRWRNPFYGKPSFFRWLASRLFKI